MWKFLGWWVFLLLILPFAVAGWYSVSTGERVTDKEASRLQVTVQTAGGEQRMGVTEFLTGVLAGQISEDYEQETLKAQAVIARTCLFEKAGDRLYIDAAETGLQWRSESERRSAWGVRFKENNEKMRQAVQATDGIVLRYRNQLITPAYFAVSNGRTRSSAEAWGVEVPWLQSVESDWDLKAGDYETVIVKTRRQLIAEVRESVPDFDCDAASLASTCQITETDSAGYVLQMQIGNKLLSGDDFRYALNLPSACFDISFEGNAVTLTVRGSGHGVGFDQYGANMQALQGKNYEELLLYYLNGVKVGE